ncbi:hypothetical protein HanPSC8_Chr13g0592331 [Helianthus annuus]|nr:hypothetical protein HanPSC8_Chr13g0592331 [Helianthus annuus]
MGGLDWVGCRVRMGLGRDGLIKKGQNGYWLEWVQVRMGLGEDGLKNRFRSGHKKVTNLHQLTYKVKNNTLYFLQLHEFKIFT